jgi:hypothetical protein
MDQKMSRDLRIRRRPYLCARSGSFCPLRVVCWFNEKCPVGGPYFKKISNSYVLQRPNAEPRADVAAEVNIRKSDAAALRHAGERELISNMQ